MGRSLWNRIYSAGPIFAAFIVVVISLATGWLIDGISNALSNFLQERCAFNRRIYSIIAGAGASRPPCFCSFRWDC